MLAAALALEALMLVSTWIASAKSRLLIFMLSMLTIKTSSSETLATCAKVRLNAARLESVKASTDIGRERTMRTTCVLVVSEGWQADIMLLPAGEV